MRLPLALRVQGVALVLPALLWQVPTPAPGRFELLAADIGQGNAVLVRTHGHALLYDTGPRFSAESDAGHRILVPLLRALNVRLDTVLVSHRDSDHSGGAAAVLALQPQAQLLSSLEDAHTLLASQPAARSARCQAGQHWVWDGVQFDVLHPLPSAYAAPGQPDASASAMKAPKPNAMSCVLRISDGQRTALLVGDIEQPQEARLLADAAPLKTDLLLVPHHGSKTSSSAAFLDATQPVLALVQAGYRNRFGHPAAPVRARYDERHIPIVDTAHCGAATWRSDHPQAVRCERVESRRYWHHRP
jgi:competence protein ComEC